MKQLLCLCAALMMAFSAATAFAADVTGTWTGSMVTPDGNSFQITFTFKQDGAKLTGTVAGPQGDPMEISDGKVDGEDVYKRQGLCCPLSLRRQGSRDSGCQAWARVRLQRRFFFNLLNWAEDVYKRQVSST